MPITLLILIKLSSCKVWRLFGLKGAEDIGCCYNDLVAMATIEITNSSVVLHSINLKFSM